MTASSGGMSSTATFTVIPPLPEITVRGWTTEITCGQATPIDMGTVSQNLPGARRTFIIRNDGDGTLTLTTPFADTPHFAVGQPGKTSLATGESTTFTVTLKTDTLWSGSEVVSFENNDGDGGDGVESPFTFTVSGTVVPPGAWENPSHPLDVNDDGYISMQDALIIVSFLRSTGAQPVPQGPGTAPFPVAPPPYYDVNGDGVVSSQDALILANFLYFNGQQPVGQGQGNSPLPATPPPSFDAGRDGFVTTQDTSASAAAPTSQPAAPAPAKALPAENGSLALFGEDKATPWMALDGSPSIGPGVSSGTPVAGSRLDEGNPAEETAPPSWPTASIASLVETALPLATGHWDHARVKGLAWADARSAAKPFGSDSVVELTLPFARRPALAASVVDRIMADTRWDDDIDFVGPSFIDKALPTSLSGSGWETLDDFFARHDKSQDSRVFAGHAGALWRPVGPVD